MAGIKPFQQWIEEIADEYNKFYASVCEEAGKEWIKTAKNKMETRYNSIINEFYSDYNPSTYIREHRLYSLLKFKDIDSMAFSYYFDETQLPYRNGYSGEDGLYDTVFKKGYHGGAKIGQSDYLIPTRHDRQLYYGGPKPWNGELETDKWIKATKSQAPYLKFKSFIDLYNKGQFQKDYDDIFYRIWNKKLK